jgi:hypothetical protein
MPTVCYRLSATKGPCTNNLTIEGQRLLLATDGGGGEGGDTAAMASGNNGSDPSTTAAAAGGSLGAPRGGDGGAGAVPPAAAAGAGRTDDNSGSNRGGGDGAGLIKSFAIPISAPARATGDALTATSRSSTSLACSSPTAPTAVRVRNRD